MFPVPTALAQFRYRLPDSSGTVCPQGSGRQTASSKSLAQQALRIDNYRKETSLNYFARLQQSTSFA